MEEAWLILLQSYSELVTREATSHSEEEGQRDIQTPSKWDRLVAEFYDIFDPPGMPAERYTVHQIELLPNAKPHYRH